VAQEEWTKIEDLTFKYGDLFGSEDVAMDSDIKAVLNKVGMQISPEDSEALEIA
jgi:hypothetical protein